MLPCWVPSKHQALAQRKGYTYSPCMLDCGFLFPARPGAIPVLPSGFCPLGSMLAQGPFGTTGTLGSPSGKQGGEGFLF